MDQKIILNLDAVANTRNPRAVKFLRAKIGEYRLEAQKQWGYVRWHIHSQANAIEIELENALYVAPSGKVL